METLSGRDVPFAPVNNVDEVVADPQAQHLNLFVPVVGALEGAETAVRGPFVFDGQQPKDVRPAPLIDQYGDEIREWIKTKGSWPT